MFGSSKSNKPQSRIACLIGAGTTINGDINFSGGVGGDGHFRGNWNRSEKGRVGEKGRTRGGPVHLKKKKEEDGHRRE